MRGKNETLTRGIVSDNINRPSVTKILQRSATTISIFAFSETSFVLVFSVKIVKYFNKTFVFNVTY